MTQRWIAAGYRLGALVTIIAVLVLLVGGDIPPENPTIGLMLNFAAGMAALLLSVTAIIDAFVRTDLKD